MKIDLIFTSKNKQAVYEYLLENKTNNRVQITYRTLAADIGCTQTGARKIIFQLQSEGYLKILATGNGTLIELKEKIAI